MQQGFLEQRHLYSRVFAVAVWSGVNVAGTRLQDLHPDIGKANDPENWDQVHREVINRCAVLCLMILNVVDGNWISF